MENAIEKQLPGSISRLIESIAKTALPAAVASTVANQAKGL